MEKAKKLLKKPLVWLGVALVLALAGAGAFFGLQKAQAAPPQPFPYVHSVHIENGIPCLYCHPGAVRGQTAGLPTVQKCQGCHANMSTKDKPALKAWADYVSDNPQVYWVPVAIQPDYVYFSHRPHINAGVNCEQCHGDVSKMADARYQGDQNMGWCLNCHRAQAPDKVEKLTDCATCHK